MSNLCCPFHTKLNLAFDVVARALEVDRRGPRRLQIVELLRQPLVEVRPRHGRPLALVAEGLDGQGQDADDGDGRRATDL